MNDVSIFFFGAAVGILGLIGLFWVYHLLAPHEIKSIAPTSTASPTPKLQADGVFVHAALKRVPTPDQLDAWGKLTPRKRQVAVLVARGYSNAEVASEMVIRKSTVEGYLKEIYQLLDLRSRTELANFVRDIALE